MLALQAQEPAAPYLALWNRIDRFDATDLDRAWAAGAIVKDGCSGSRCTRSPRTTSRG
ncbi:MAG: crosslink repair DNA glycosylase YcaQ family protein [Ilumatobacteraceae bacterium]